MNDDLISRSALKRACSEMVRGSNNSDFIPCPSWNDAMGLIDNAPTVFDCRSCKNNGNERECVDCYDYSNYVHYENRRQGVWIEFKGGYYKCDKCGEVERAKKSFCPNCGAKMKGGEEE